MLTHAEAAAYSCTRVLLATSDLCSRAIFGMYLAMQGGQFLYALL